MLLHWALGDSWELCNYHKLHVGPGDNITIIIMSCCTSKTEIDIFTVSDATLFEGQTCPEPQWMYGILAEFKPLKPFYKGANLKHF